MRKRCADTDLEFFLVLTYFSAGSRLRALFWGSPHKMGLVNISLLTSSWLVFNCPSLPYHVSPSTPQKHDLSPHLRLLCRDRNIRFHLLCTCVYDLRTSSFHLSFLITTSHLDWLLPIYLLVYLFSLFEPFNCITLGSNSNIGGFTTFP